MNRVAKCISATALLTLFLIPMCYGQQAISNPSPAEPEPTNELIIVESFESRLGYEIGASAGLFLIQGLAFPAAEMSFSANVTPGIRIGFAMNHAAVSIFGPSLQTLDAFVSADSAPHEELGAILSLGGSYIRTSGSYAGIVGVMGGLGIRISLSGQLDVFMKYRARLAALGVVINAFEIGIAFRF